MTGTVPDPSRYASEASPTAPRVTPNAPAESTAPDEYAVTVFAQFLLLAAFTRGVIVTIIFTPQGLAAPAHPTAIATQTSRGIVIASPPAASPGTQCDDYRSGADLSWLRYRLGGAVVYIRLQSGSHARFTPNGHHLDGRSKAAAEVPGSDRPVVFARGIDGPMPGHAVMHYLAASVIENPNHVLNPGPRLTVIGPGRSGQQNGTARTRSILQCISHVLQQAAFRRHDR